MRDMEEALAALREMDPPGVGARDLRDSLLIQLEQRGLKRSLAFRLVKRCWRELAAHKYGEAALLLGAEPEEVAAALESVVEPISLEEPLYTDGGDAMYVIDQVRDPDSEDSWISGLEFRQTVAGLTPREKRIMELRYLKGETQMEVAREIGISQAQVSRLEKAALEQFRHK